MQLIPEPASSVDRTKIMSTLKEIPVNGDLTTDICDVNKENIKDVSIDNLEKNVINKASKENNDVSSISSIPTDVLSTVEESEIKMDNGNIDSVNGDVEQCNQQINATTRIDEFQIINGSTKGNQSLSESDCGATDLKVVNENMHLAENADAEKNGVTQEESKDILQDDITEKHLIVEDSAKLAKDENVMQITVAEQQQAENESNSKMIEEITNCLSDDTSVRKSDDNEPTSIPVDDKTEKVINSINPDKDLLDQVDFIATEVKEKIPAHKQSVNVAMNEDKITSTSEASKTQDNSSLDHEEHSDNIFNDDIITTPNDDKTFSHQKTSDFDAKVSEDVKMDNVANASSNDNTFENKSSTNEGDSKVDTIDDKNDNVKSEQVTNISANDNEMLSHNSEIIKTSHFNAEISEDVEMDDVANASRDDSSFNNKSSSNEKDPKVTIDDNNHKVLLEQVTSMSADKKKECLSHLETIKPSHVNVDISEDVEMNDEANVPSDDNNLKNKSSSNEKDPKVVTIHDDNDKVLLEQVANMSADNEKELLSHNLESIKPADISEDVEMEYLGNVPSENNSLKNKSFNSLKDPKVVTIDNNNDKVSSEQVTNILENSEKELLNKKAGTITKATQDVYINDIIDTSTIENTVSEEDSDLVQKEPTADVISVSSSEVSSTPEATETSDKKELVSHEVKEPENNCMEIDDVEIVDVEKEQNNAYISSCRNESSSVEESIKTNVSETNEPAPSIEKSEKHCAIDTAAEENKAKATKDNDKVEILDDDIKIVEHSNTIEKTSSPIEKEKSPEKSQSKALPVVCKLSNTLDILSDDEDEPPKTGVNEKENKDNTVDEKQCINIDDDDDIMLIEDMNSKENDTENSKTEPINNKVETLIDPGQKIDLETGAKESNVTEITELSPKINEKDTSPEKAIYSDAKNDKLFIDKNEKSETKKPLLPENFLKSAKKNLSDMTRDELEDFCIMRIVESIVDRSNLSEIKTKIKTMSQNIDEYRKKAVMLTKQNRDLQVVLKSVQEEQKKRSDAPIQPLKITRSVGMQVLMTEKIDPRRRGPIPTQVTPGQPVKPMRVVQNNKVTKLPGTPNIPVPRLVPANSPAKPPVNSPVSKAVIPNGMKTPSPAQKGPEKRTHGRMQATSSVTVDLTDDEPPAKINNKNSPIPPVRLVPPQNLMAQQRPFNQNLSSPRKVYIPISGPQAQSIRPGQTVMVKNIQGPTQRPRLPSMPRMQQSPVRMNRVGTNRHPAPLPDAMKQYTPPTWKALPPAPDLKLSKVENGIVISWKIDGYQESSYETIASYQLYAYQETSSPPSTALWKKIGDVKALPLPMACTLTQFMAGFKYYFAVRAVDIRSRLGPFSLPGSILLLNKV